MKQKKIAYMMMAAIGALLMAAESEQKGSIPSALTAMEETGGIPADDFSDADLLLMEGEGLSIVGTKERNQQIRTVTKEAIEKSGAQDIPSLLLGELHVNVASNGAYGNLSGVSLRGFSGGRVAILIDGIPVNSPQSGGFDLGKININSIEKIEVIYGGSDTKYNVSGAVGGVINIVTIKKREKDFTFGGGFSNLSYVPLSSYANLADTQNANFNVRAGTEKFRWSLDLTGNRAANNFLYTNSRNLTLSREGNGVWDGGGSTSFLFFLPDSTTLLFSGDVFYSEKKIAGPLDSKFGGEQKDIASKASILLDADYLLAGKLDTEFSASHAFTSIDWKDQTAHSFHVINTLNLINRWNWYAKDSLILSAGADAEISLLSSSEIGEKINIEGGAYLTAEIKANRKIDVIPSAKLIRSLDNVIPVPKLGLIFHGNDGLTVKNNYYRTFKLPTFNDRYWPEGKDFSGDPGLKPEDGIGADIVVVKNIDKAINFQSSLYANYQRDSILWQNSNGLTKPSNIGEAFFFGSDTSVVSEISKTVTLSGSYAFLMTYLLTSDFEFSDDKRMPYQSMHTFGGTVKLAWEKSSLSFIEHYQSARFTDVLNVGRLPPFFTMDVLYNQAIGKGKNLFITIKNAFNESYSTIDGYPLPGTSVTAGIRMQFD